MTLTRTALRRAGAAVVAATALSASLVVASVAAAPPARATTVCTAGSSLQPAIDDTVTCTANVGISVPLGATSLEVVVVGGGGAAGGRSTSGGTGGAGGSGAAVTATLPLAGVAVSGSVRVGAGATSAGGGGRMSAIWFSTSAVQAVAGGGGGGGFGGPSETGGAGGSGYSGPSSTTGTAGGAMGSAGGGGGGGSSVGAAGTGGSSSGQPGTQSSGPLSAFSDTTGGAGGYAGGTAAGGAGGSGPFGGGGGAVTSASGAGGGGGGSYVMPGATGVTVAAVTSGPGAGGAAYASGSSAPAGSNGSVTFTFRTSPVDLTGFGTGNTPTATGSNLLTLAGTGFTAGTTVTVGGQPCTTPAINNYFGAQRQTMLCTAASSLAVGSHDVVVTQGGTGTTDSIVGGFVKAAPPSMAPTGVTASVSGSTVTVAWARPTTLPPTVPLGYRATLTPAGPSCDVAATTAATVTCTITGVPAGSYGVAVGLAGPNGQAPAPANTATMAGQLTVGGGAPTPGPGPVRGPAGTATGPGSTAQGTAGGIAFAPTAVGSRAAGAPVDLTSTTLEPGTRWTARLSSSAGAGSTSGGGGGTVLGRGTVPAGGLDVDVALPRTLPVGSLRIDLTGTGADGQPATSTTWLRVGETGALEYVAAGSAGTIAVDSVVGRSATGAPVAITASNLGTGVPWTVEMHSAPVVLASGTASGGFTQTATLPANVPTGQHRVVLTSTNAAGQTVVSEAWFRVAEDGTITFLSATDPDTVLTAATLASTGVSIAVPLAGGGVLLLLGLVGLVVGRRHTRV